MKKLNATDLRNLKHGDKVYQFKHYTERRLYFVGLMPRSSNYLIFCDGEHLEYLYVHTDGTFKYDWYNGDITSKDIGEILLLKTDEEIKRLEKSKQSIKDIYIKS
jgi:hypothetical protein